MAAYQVYKEMWTAFGSYLRNRYKEASSQYQDALSVHDDRLYKFWAERVHEYGSMLFMMELMAATAAKGGDVQEKVRQSEDTTLALLEADNARLREEIGKLRALTDVDQPSCCMKPMKRAVGAR